MSNLTINRSENQQFVQYPHWIAQGKAFSLGEKGLLDIILSFKDYLSKESLVNFTSDGKRAINTAWKGLIQKGILIAKSFKSADNRFAWSYTVNLEKVSMLSPQKIVVNYTEIASKYGVSEDVARAITEEAIAQAMPTASIADIQRDPITIFEPTDNDKNEPTIPISTPEIGSKPAFEVQSMPISIPEMDFNPFFEVQSMPIPMLEIRSKPIIEASEMPIAMLEMGSKPIIEVPKAPISTIEMDSKPIVHLTIPTQTPQEKRNEFAATLLNDKKLLDYLRTESQRFEVNTEIILSFHKRLDMNQLEHPNYEKYAQHFRNWLPDFLKYKEVGSKIKAAKTNEVKDGNIHSEKCGNNKVFNILRKKLQNPKEDYMTYQGWVLELAEISENLSPADITYKDEMVSLYKNGQLRQRYHDMNAKIANA